MLLYSPTESFWGRSSSLYLRCLLVNSALLQRSLTFYPCEIFEYHSQHENVDEKRVTGD